MRHEHLVVTVEAGMKARIDDQLDGGESLEAWIADAVERKLAAQSEDEERGDSRAATGESDAEESRLVSEDLALYHAADEDGADDYDQDDADDYDEGFEYVDDCAI